MALELCGNCIRQLRLRAVRNREEDLSSMFEKRRGASKWHRLTATFAVAGAVLGLHGCSSFPQLVGPRLPAGYGVGEVRTGSACGLLFLGFIPIKSNSRTERAYKTAVGSASGGLADTKLRYSWFVIPGAGLLLCTDVEGRSIQ